MNEYSSYEFRGKVVESTNIMASFDGCEGGDYLRCLSDALSMVHYGNDELVDAERLCTMIYRDCYNLWVWAQNEGVDIYGEEEIEDVSNELSNVWNAA